MCFACLPHLQVLAPLQGALPQQTGVIIQPQQIVLASGNKVQGNTQVGTPSRHTHIQNNSPILPRCCTQTWSSNDLTRCGPSSPPQLLQAAATIEQTGQAAAAAQVQQVQQAPSAAAAAPPQAAQQQPQAQPQPQAQRPPVMLQVDGSGDTSSEEEEDEEEEYDDDDEEEKEKEAGEDWQVEEVCTVGQLDY